jgi:hypothetical protein
MLTHNTNGKMTKRTREAAKRLEKGICSLTSYKLSHGSGRRKWQSFTALLKSPVCSRVSIMLPLHRKRE